MSESLCIHDGDQHIGNICVPGRFRYQVAVHTPYQRGFTAIGEQHDTIAEAFAALGEALEENRKRLVRYNRAGIWAVEQGESYYDPHQIYEVVPR